MEPPRRTLSRRSFLALAALVLGALAVAFGRSPLRRAAAPGPLAPEVSDTLVAMVSAMLHARVERAHYAGMFAFYAQRVPGYRAFYQRLAAGWNAAADARAGRPFARCSEAEQRAVAAAAFPREGAIGTLWAALTDADSLLAARHFRAPVVQLFLRTDALRAIGYEDWPGTPRLLARYTQPIGS
jgi:hypothetical protein